MWYYEIVTNQPVKEELSPVDKVKIYQYEIKRQEEIISSLQSKLDVAKKSLSEKIDKLDSIKKEAIKHLDQLKKDLK